MAFTPPSCSLGIDRSQDEPVVQDPMHVAFAFPAGTSPMMAQPMADGRKAVKFAEPIVQGTFFVCLLFCFYIFCLTFVTSFFGFLLVMANLMRCTWQLELLQHGTYICCHVAIPFAKHMATGVVATWQLQFNVLGNCSCCHMATAVAATWQLQLSLRGNSLLFAPTFHILHPFFTITCLFPSILTHCFDPCSHP